ncbi:MAG: Uma2 family endonuclease [Planctomycetaceae bacterium]
MSTATRISAVEFERMIDAGVFVAEDGSDSRKMELILGELREQISPPNPPHEGAVDWLTRWSCKVTDESKVVVRVQNTIGIPEFDSVPLPDLAWMIAAKNFRKQRPQPDDVLLVVEVSDTSLRYDLGPKAELYAQAGLADYWVVDLNALTLHIHREPVDGKYTNVTRAAVGQSISPLAVPDVKLELSELFAQ